MTRRFRYVTLSATAFALLVVGIVVFVFVVGRGNTPRIDSPGSVASLEQIRLGGVEQWVLIRGRDRTKPILLFLHGGPGMPAMYLAHAFQRELERDFVIVHWDRQGAGKSFEAWRQGTPLSVRQTLEDTYELTRNLRERFAQDQVYLVGHSWGSYLGLLAIHGHPEYYRAFIGMGQLAGSREQASALRQAFLSRTINESDDPKLPTRNATVEINEDDLFRSGGELHASRSFLPLLMTGLMAPEYTLRDVLNVKKGAELVGREMSYDVVPKPLEGEIPKFDVPVFFFLGRYDFNTPSELAAEYLERLDAPLKELAWFENSAHFPFYEEPDLFRREMLRAELAVSTFRKKGPANEGDRPPSAALEQSVAADAPARRR